MLLLKRIILRVSFCEGFYFYLGMKLKEVKRLDVDAGEVLGF